MTNGTAGALAVGNRNAGKIYSVSKTGKFLKSTNGGRTWVRLLLTSPSVVDAYIPREQNAYDDMVLVIEESTGCMYKITPVIKSFINVQEDLPVDPKSARIVAYKNDRNIIYALVNQAGWQLKRSLDGGNTWESMDSFDFEPAAISLWPYDSLLLYYLGSGIFYSVDGGETPINKTGNWADVLGAFVDPVKMEVVWVKAT